MASATFRKTSSSAAAASTSGNRHQWRVIAAPLITLLPYILARAELNQAYGIMYVWADTAVDRHILAWEMPVTWMGVFDGAMTIVRVLIANA